MSGPTSWSSTCSDAAAACPWWGVGQTVRIICVYAAKRRRRFARSGRPTFVSRCRAFPFPWQRPTRTSPCPSSHLSTPFMRVRITIETLTIAGHSGHRLARPTPSGSKRSWRSAISRCNRLVGENSNNVVSR